jgi:sulfite exporter TauE/SafE
MKKDVIQVAFVWGTVRLLFAVAVASRIVEKNAGKIFQLLCNVLTFLYVYLCIRKNPYLMYTDKNLIAKAIDFRTPRDGISR